MFKTYIKNSDSPSCMNLIETKSKKGTTYLLILSIFIMNFIIFLLVIFLRNQQHLYITILLGLQSNIGAFKIYYQ